MDDILGRLYDTALERRDNPAEGSYTRYLFEQGEDKMLKKCAEECGEVIIAAKNGEHDPLTGEICDLLYHLAVLMAQKGVSPADVRAVLDARAQKQGNLKQFHSVDKNS